MNSFLRNMYTGKEKTHTPITTIPCQRKTISDEINQFLSGESNREFVIITSKSARIGSFKSQVKEKVLFYEGGFRISVASASEVSKVEDLDLDRNSIIKIRACFDDRCPIMFIHLSLGACAKIRAQLSLDESVGQWLDPMGDESMRQITLPMEKLVESFQALLLRMYSNLMEEISPKAAMEVFVKTSPKNPKLRSLPVEARTETYCRFPLSGRDSCTVTTNDYLCLEDEKFLNDSIIAFYLNWIKYRLAPESCLDRVHVFSSYFYKRLTSQHGAQKAPTPEESYANVKRWTRNVKLFDMDFVVVPINEDDHWFVAIICFPGLEGPVNAVTGEPCQVPARQIHEMSLATERTQARKESRKEMNELRAMMCQTLDIDDEEYASDDNIVGDYQQALSDLDFCFQQWKRDEKNESVGQEDSNTKVEKTNNVNTKDLDAQVQSQNKQNIKIKQPCILLFDSLQITNAAKIVRTLRNYLQCEYREKVGDTVRAFTKENFPGSCPRVMQQPNFWDCGVFLLQYMETFFQKPLSDYTLPISEINKRWFSREEIKLKRAHIANVIQTLAREQTPSKSFYFPEIRFSPDFGSGYSDSEIESDDQILSGKVSELKSELSVFLASPSLTSESSRIVPESSSAESPTNCESRQAFENGVSSPRPDLSQLSSMDISEILNSPNTRYSDDFGETEDDVCNDSLLNTLSRENHSPAVISCGTTRPSENIDSIFPSVDATVKAAVIDREAMMKPKSKNVPKLKKPFKPSFARIPVKMPKLENDNQVSSLSNGIEPSRTELSVNNSIRLNMPFGESSVSKNLDVTPSDEPGMTIADFLKARSQKKH